MWHCFAANHDLLIIATRQLYVELACLEALDRHVFPVYQTDRRSLDQKLCCIHVVGEHGGLKDRVYGITTCLTTAIDLDLSFHQHMANGFGQQVTYLYYTDSTSNVRPTVSPP